MGKTISIAHRAKEHVLIPAKIAPKDRQIKYCKVKGDSMATVLQDCSLIAVDLEDREPQDDSLFLLNWKDKIMVRRLKIQDNYLHLCPDNLDRDRFPIEICPMKKTNTGWNPIIGRVVWSMAKL